MLFFFPKNQISIDIFIELLIWNVCMLVRLLVKFTTNRTVCKLHHSIDNLELSIVKIQKRSNQLPCTCQYSKCENNCKSCGFFVSSISWNHLERVREGKEFGSYTTFRENGCVSLKHNEGFEISGWLNLNFVRNDVAALFLGGMKK